MKLDKKILTLSLSAAICAASFTAAAKSYKRGVAENRFYYTQQVDFLSPGVSWYYNWGMNATAGISNQIYDYDGLEFIPMTWNTNYKQSIERLRQYCAAHPEVKYLLGYNEPNFKAQANMTPAQAAADWPQVQALARELGLKLVAPALNYSPDAPYSQPSRWMDEFVALVGPDAFDYVAIHNYGGLGVMKTLAGEFWQKYGKPVWVTEFCYWPDEGNTNAVVAPADQMRSMVETVQWLEQTDYIYRYAWFMAIGEYEAAKGPNYGLQKLTFSGKNPVFHYSDLGYVYTYMSDFDRSVFNAVNTVVAATDYVDQDKLMLGKGANPDCPKPIEITQFNSGAWVDYQFDVPSDGTYTFTLTASGMGEPTRFDPVIGLYTVKADGTDGTRLDRKTLTLSNDNAVYRAYEFKADLPAGRQTLRVKDLNPYSPSGIHISAVALRDDNSGIGDVVADGSDAPVSVYNLQGIEIRSGVSASDALDGLPAGIYIVDGRKVIVR